MDSLLFEIHDFFHDGVQIDTLMLLRMAVHATTLIFFIKIA
jgi:hypothetical protein